VPITKARRLWRLTHRRGARQRVRAADKDQRKAKTPENQHPHPAPLIRLPPIYWYQNRLNDNGPITLRQTTRLREEIAINLL
jgi:hypothetical protein